MLEETTWSILILITASNAGPVLKEYHCDYISHERRCTIFNVHYDRTETTSIFPRNYPSVSISPGSIVTVFDRQLHQELGQPESVEMARVQMEQLEIPDDLFLGNFLGNNITHVTVEEGEKVPNLRFLDLSGNKINNVTNINRLVNLHTLLLYGNEIKELEPEAFANLTRLMRLDLGANQIEQLSGDMLPASLKELRIVGNRIKSLDLYGFHLPIIGRLLMSNNQLETLDASALILAMPKLKEIDIAGNSFKSEATIELREVFRKHNITES